MIWIMELKEAYDTLRTQIAILIAKLETWNTFPNILISLNLANEEREGGGKETHLRRMTKLANDQVIISATKKILTLYPGTREKPSKSDCQILQDALWWIENKGIQRISNVSRYGIIESLEGISFWGRISIKEFFYSVLPLVLEKFYIPEIYEDGYVYKRQIDFYVLFFGGKHNSEPKYEKITILEYFRHIEIEKWPDERFCLFVEKIVHPELQAPESQKFLVNKLNNILEKDNFELKIEDRQGGFPVYKVRSKSVGVSGTPKYIIFASIGLKPDIVIDDALNMDIRIIGNLDQCLVYDQVPPNDDFTWEMLVNWLCQLNNKDNNEDTRRELGKRLDKSLQSEPEKMLFRTYFKSFQPIFHQKLPALLPQVYLHYDPRNRGERKQQVLNRQRMDFLMLLRNSKRIVIEIDGKHHYSDEKGYASPKLYAQMVAEDRRIKNIGYEVYRFGGAEFVDEKIRNDILNNFFKELFERHNIYS